MSLPPRLLILGLGYSAQALARRLTAQDWDVIGANRSGVAPDAFSGTMMRIDDVRAVRAALEVSSHVLSSVPPVDSLAAPHDPVLSAYGPALAEFGGRWIGYLSSTGVYGDTQGAWVDEASPIGLGRRNARSLADLAWQELAGIASAPVHIFRIAGIYGPGRSPFERLSGPGAIRIHKPGHLFSRIHVDDIATAVAASMAQPSPERPAIYNLCDDEPAEGSAVIEHAADMAGVPPPPLVPVAEAVLSPMARGFYAEFRRVRNDKMKRDLGVALAYPNYRVGLAAIWAMMGQHKQESGA
jgi:nucleoside-diphosphate-sugar epimerase